MNPSLDQGLTVRHRRLVSEPTDNDVELQLLAAALRELREEGGYTQESAGASADPTYTRQGWSLVEAGEIKGLLTPDLQIRVMTAIGKTRDDLLARKEQLRLSSGNPAPARASGRVEQVVFLTADGQVTLSYPPKMTAEGLQDLQEQVGIFLRVASRRAAN